MATREDIAKLMASIGLPGENQVEKEAAVREQFPEMNMQGFHIADDLTNFVEY